MLTVYITIDFCGANLRRPGVSKWHSLKTHICALWKKDKRQDVMPGRLITFALSIATRPVMLRLTSVRSRPAGTPLSLVLNHGCRQSLRDPCPLTRLT